MNAEITAVLAGESQGCVVCGDCIVLMPQFAGKVDLVFGSPPYENRRTYGIDFCLTGQAWVGWMVEVVRTSLSVCHGLVAFVVSGKTEGYEYSATPELLMADLKRAGICLRRPPIYQRDGIPGSGGPDWWKGNYEPIVCATNGGKLPWSENTAIGEPPKWEPGGTPSHRMRNGKRAGCHSTDRRPDGTLKPRVYDPPDISNPGLIINCGTVGGGNIGDPLAHQNEAPFPEKLAEAFILSFCPPGGTVLDPFSGSGTTLAVAKKTGRNYIGIDLRKSQVELSRTRLRNVTPPLFSPATAPYAKEGANG